MDGRELVAIALGLHGGTTNKVPGNLDGPCQRPLSLLGAVTLTHNGSYQVIFNLVMLKLSLLTINNIHNVQLLTFI
jgi:hypothetical protein